MLENLKSLAKKTPIRKVYFLPHRFGFASSYHLKNFKETVSWLMRSNELENFTYELTELNKKQLAGFIAVITGSAVETVERYFQEIESDERLREHIRTLTLASGDRFIADIDARYARRIGWYALVRIQKPKVVVETGVDKGLGTCVLAAALLKNKEEGSPGQVFGTDINPRAGYLLKAPYDQVGKILYGDSIESLKKLDVKVDLFINDSDHSAEYEATEYETVQGKLATGAIVLGDNAHVTDKLFHFASKTGRKFLFFQEKPKGHWYPGAGIGAAW